MKILQVISSLSFGGAEKLVTDLSVGLKAKGHLVDLITYQKTDTSLKRTLQEAGCTIYELGEKVYHPSYINKAQKLMEQYEIVHTHNYAPQIFGAINAKFNKNNTVFITTEHSPSNRRRKYKWYAWIDKWMYQQYHKVVCISAESKNNLLAFTQQADLDIPIIPNGIDVEKFHTAQPLKNIKHEKFIIVNVAGLRQEKDQDTLIKGMSYLPKEKFELWLVGDGVRRQELENLVINLQLNDNVKFLGLRSDVPAILKTADAIVMSSHYEGLSLSNIEGMSCNRPFLACDVTGLRSITEGAGILFPYQDAQAFANEIIKLQQDKVYYSSVAQKCYERAKNYDISKTIDDYENLYASLLQ